VVPGGSRTDGNRGTDQVGNALLIWNERIKAGVVEILKVDRPETIAGAGSNDSGFQGFFRA
jgi:hypothetical protein